VVWTWIPVPQTCLPWTVSFSLDTGTADVSPLDTELLQWCGHGYRYCRRVSLGQYPSHWIPVLQMCLPWTQSSCSGVDMDTGTADVSPLDSILLGDDNKVATIIKVRGSFTQRASAHNTGTTRNGRYYLNSYGRVRRIQFYRCCTWWPSASAGG
jgi:hypothetical protein